MAGAEALYTTEVLSLATSLAGLPLDPALPLRGSARSQVCGSTIALGLETGADGRIEQLGLKVQACAIGQAAAAIFAGSARGQARKDIAEALSEIDLWLSGQGTLPRWPGFAAIERARDYPARHGAILLAWRAALDALPSQALPG